MRTTTSPRLGHAGPRAAAMLVALTIAACSSGGAAQGTATTNAAGNAPEEFGLSLADLAVRIETTEGLVARCMADAGFTYVALDFVSIKAAMDSDNSAPGVSGEDYVKQFGLGITTQFDQPIISFGAGPVNAVYRDGLAPSEQVAFERALWGDAADWNHPHAVEAEDFSQTGGCTRLAAEQTYTAKEISGSYVNPSDQRIEQDPRMIAALASWADCMRTDGYQYDSPSEVEADLHDRLDALLLGQDPTKLTGQPLEQLHDLQGEELAIAAALTTCEEEHIEPVQATLESELYGAPQP